jgi:hypothetical protein
MSDGRDGRVQESMYTIGVFQDVASADRGIAALVADGFAPADVSVLAKASPEAEDLVRRHLGAAPQPIDVFRIGPVVSAGALAATLQGPDTLLGSGGLAKSCSRAGFQSHDGQIYESLVQRGGVLVAIQSVPRAADALARLHAYGGGNAAIGAWAGRV